ncbi:uncharacterized protein LOC134844230 [Symsagittifera roscoffensis]|uniref:uncharacterized protein LOC134844230 n=1 Tax=Symsagittifera roscoffensis TaxID=84072 RepID=UPI00307BB038
MDARIVCMFLVAVSIYKISSNTEVLLKKCRKNISDICATAPTDKYCCVMDGEKCCSESQYNEDKKKLVDKIIELEKKSQQGGSSHNEEKYIDSNSGSRWKRSMIICFSAIVLSCLACCVVDFLWNLCSRFSKTLTPTRFKKNNHESRLPQPARRKSFLCFAARNKQRSPSADSEDMGDSLEGSIKLNSSANVMVPSKQSPMTESRASTPEAYQDQAKALTRTRRELQFLKAKVESDCTKDMRRLEISVLPCPNQGTQSADNLSPSKKPSNCVEVEPTGCSRNCHSLRNSPVFLRSKSHPTNAVKFSTATRSSGAIPKSSSLKFATMHSMSSRDQDSSFVQREIDHYLQSESSSGNINRSYHTASANKTPYLTTTAEFFEADC